MERILLTTLLKDPFTTSDAGFGMWQNPEVVENVTYCGKFYKYHIFVDSSQK